MGRAATTRGGGGIRAGTKERRKEEGIERMGRAITISNAVKVKEVGLPACLQGEIRKRVN